MRAWLPGALVLLLLVSGLFPLAGGQEGSDEPPCIQPPEVARTYEWAYEDDQGNERFEEVLEQRLTSSVMGHHNMTTLGYMVRDASDEWIERGRFLRFMNGTPWPLGRLSQDTWTPNPDGGETHRIDQWDGPLEIVMKGAETCPGEFWRFETHRTAWQDNPPARGEVNESWQVRALRWEPVDTPAGTFDALPVTAVRLNDCKRITTWYSPEAQAAVRVRETQGLDQAPSSPNECRADLPVEHDWKLTWYILDERPIPRFKIEPPHPHAGDTVTLNATPSWDPDGEVTGYRWVVHQAGEQTEHHGPVVVLPEVPEGTLQARVFVTDDADRTSTLGTTVYVPPPGGSGVSVAGPLAAYEGDFVRLEADTPFDPLRIRWRVADQVVGDGLVYTFRMNQTVTLQIDAIHPSGRVHSTNHTVTLLEGTNPDASGSGGAPGEQGSRRQAPDQWPQGGSSVLALLDPLEGQVVEPRFTASIWTSNPATLAVDGEEVWSGQGPSAEVALALDPGRHTLELTSDHGRHVVNVTVSDRGSADGLTADGDGAASSPIPAASGLLVIGVLGALAGALGRPGRRA